LRSKHVKYEEYCLLGRIAVYAGVSKFLSNYAASLLRIFTQAAIKFHRIEFKLFGKWFGTNKQINTNCLNQNDLTNQPISQPVSQQTNKINGAGSFPWKVIVI